MDSTSVSMNSAVRRIQCFDECKVSMNSIEYCMNLTESSKNSNLWRIQLLINPQVLIN